jgi:hypothetical protein
MAPKRKAKNTAVNTVVGAITECETLSADVRSLLGTILPAILNTNKIDRHPFEAEVVGQAAEVLSDVGKSMEAAHGEALAKQTAIISPAERTAREAKEKEAAEKQQLAQSHVDACDAAKKEADKSVHDAEHSVKASQKEETAAEKLVAKTAQKKSTLEGATTNGFAALTTGAPKPEKDAAVKQITKLAKENGLDNTLLQAFGLACQTDYSSRSEFEVTSLSAVKTKLDEALAGVSKQLADEEAIVEQKKAGTAAAREKLGAAEAAQKAGVETLAAAKESLKEAKKNYSQAIANREGVWEEMKTACDAQDELLLAVKNFKEVILPAFEEVKEKVAPVEEPAEPPEKKLKTAEEGTAEPAPVEAVTEAPPGPDANAD